MKSLYLVTLLHGIFIIAVMEKSFATALKKSTNSSKILRRSRPFIISAEDAASPCGVSGRRQCVKPDGADNELHCITKEQECDGTVHCRDAQDELNCTCTSRIKPEFKCDLYDDCPDGEDEKGCGICGAGERACFPADPTGPTFCVQKRHICDGFRHCRDGSDEACFRLSPDPQRSQGSRGWSSRGFLQSRDDEESWSPVCPTDARIPNLVKNLCDELVGDRGSSDDFKNVPNADISRAKCPSGSLVHVTCAAASCQGAIDIQASTRTKSPSVAPRGDKPNKDFIDPKKRLIGGEDAPEGSWPSIVSLRKDGVHDCGGTVLSASYVMVAAHCMRRPRSHLFEVHAGLYKRSTFAPTAQLVPVDKVYVHVNISSNSLVNDIAILHLKEPLHLNKWVRPVCLPDSSKVWIMGHECAVAGWGFIEPRTHTVDRLQHALLPISSPTQCQQVYGLQRIPNLDQVLCAGLQEGGRDACSGDSGGPLMCRVCDTRGSILDCHSRGNLWTQDGIVSFGKGCAEPGVPGVYTRVQYYLPWIQNILNSTYKASDVTLYEVSTAARHYCRTPFNASLPDAKFCDGHVDCLDAEDERNYPACRKAESAAVPEADNSFQPLALASTTANPTGTNTTCPSGSFQCATEGECVSSSVRCDGSLDCQDGSDEMRCSCLLRLFAARKSLLCDGIPDCPDSGDEACPLCPADSHECRESKQCVSKKRVCDQRFDCTFGEDEIGCISLAAANSEVLLGADDAPVRRNEGFLVIRSGASSVFSPLCTNDIQPQNLDQVCNFLGYENQTGSRYVEAPATTVYLSRYESRSSFTIDGEKNAYHGNSEAIEDERRDQSPRDGAQAIENQKLGLTSANFTANSDAGEEIDQNPPLNIRRRSKRQADSSKKDQKCSQVYVTCGNAKCGIVPRILRGVANFTGFGSQPWALGVYSGGQYICGATLITPLWAVAARGCVAERMNASASLLVVGGSHRGVVSSMRVKGPFERESSVMQVQPLSDQLLLLRLATELNETSHINPLCLPRRAPTWPGAWVRCAVVGDDGELLTRHLPLLPASACPAHRVCFQPYDVPTNTCPNRWSGLIACINSTDSKAQHVAVGHWHHNSTGCSRPTIHELLTDDLLLSIRLGMILPSPITRTQCSGHACPFGKCIAPERVCDGVPDCADFSDEPATCPMPTMRCREPRGPVQCTCPVDQRPCWDGSCIASEAFCDGKQDCARGEDEANCSCSKLTALRPDAVCDGHIDCHDGEDERHCDCPPSRGFRCFSSGNSRSCLPLHSLCNFTKDCPQGEDEQFCSALLAVSTTSDVSSPIDSSLIVIDQDVLGRPKERSAGLFMLRYRGRWYTYSYSAWPREYSEDLCKKLGFSSAITTKRTLMPNFNTDPDTVERSVQGIYRSTPGDDALDVAHIQCS